MTDPAVFLNASDAARRLGLSVKALRLYEQRGLIRPNRTGSGWRAYGPGEMARAAEIAALRKLGFSLAQIARLLQGDWRGSEPVLAAHLASLEARARDAGAMIDKVRALQNDLAQGRAPKLGDLARLAEPSGDIGVAFDLPWPWGGERFELRGVKKLTYITGPLGSGKTRLAKRLAETLPGAAFIGLDRAVAPDAPVPPPAQRALDWILEDGGTDSDALKALLAALEADGPSILVIDMIEQGLDRATQEALAAYLRRRQPGARPLFCLTRSTAILDLDSVGAEEAILFCPANHSPPFLVPTYPGAPGYEALASCLAPPEVRARSEGVIAWRPGAA